jgi:hypothetical protein
MSNPGRSAFRFNLLGSCVVLAQTGFNPCLAIDPSIGFGVSSISFWAKL